MNPNLVTGRLTYLCTDAYHTVEVRPKSLLLLQQPPGMLSPELLGLLQHTIQANYRSNMHFIFQKEKKKA